MSATTDVNPPAPSEGTGEEKPKLRPCCACPKLKEHGMNVLHETKWSLVSYINYWTNYILSINFIL